MAEIVNIIPLNPTTFEYQDYSIEDNSLITSLEVETLFTPGIDIIEYFIYDLNGDIIFEDVNGYGGYSLIDNVLTLDPQADLITQGYTEGQYNTLYNFVSPKLSSNSTDTYFISQVSPDRTEVRLDTTSIPNAFVISSSLELMNDVMNSTGSYYDFYLDFGFNQLIIANNILLDTSSIDNPTVLVKLYEPLPEQFTLNSQLWVVTQVANPVAYNISLTQTFELTDDNIYLKGPNTNLSIKDQINNSTDYNNISQLSLTDSNQGSGSLRYQLNSLLAKTGIDINIDYSNYDNFIHFSSAQTRLENFYYKLSLIEQYNYSASYSTGTTANYYVSSSNVVWQSKINEIITGFDNYEYFLYFDSGSACWPKTGPTPPYTNVTTTSVTGQAWLVSQSLVAEEYDIENNNALINAIPSYLLEDPENAQYELFIEMIGQHFDNIFLYTQDVTNKYNADNRVNYGVSKDLVADILRDMGIKIYQNNFSTNDLYSALLGLTPSGSLYNLPYTTGSLPTPTGYEYINTYVTASATGSLIPTEDINAEIYKRIYANLPYLLKKKGTVEGLRALVTLYGIPDTILQVNEFGGQDKIIANDYDLWFNQYNYAFDTLGINYVTSSFQLNTLWNAIDNVPYTMEMRFKTRGIPTDTGYYSQSLWSFDDGGGNGGALLLKYTGSAYTSGSYSGSIPNPYNEFALLNFIPDTSTPSTSASIYLPFFDGGWWSVMVNRNNGGSSTTYTVTAANKNYQGEDGNYIGFISSASVVASDNLWNTAYISYWGTSSLSSKIFSGSLQELRYYVPQLSQSEFADYVMNPYSIDSNGINTAPTELAFRATLGGELYTSSISVHPKITGSWAATQSFDGNISTFKFSQDSTLFVPNTESFFLNQFPAGIKNRVSNKIRQQNEILPYSGSNETNLPTNQVLSPFISIQQSVAVSGSYTPNIDYVEVAFSPQNEINNDIAGQLGYFNIGEYIGDPRLVSSSAETYPALDGLRNYYFEKYTANYNIWDYIRLIKYFDNSLFKMIADWTPARTDLASGIVIKQTTLERNKYPVPQPNITSSIAWIESGSYNYDIVTYNSEEVASPTLPTSVTQSYNINTYFTGSFNNASGDALVECNIWYFPPTYPSTPLVNLFNADVAVGNTTAFSFYYGGVINGSTIVFAATSSGDGVFLSGGLTGSWFEDTNIQYQPENILITGSSIQVVEITGSTGGTMPNLFGYTSSFYTGNNVVNITQSWSGSTPSLSGSVPFVNSTQEEFYNGELSGSVIQVDNGELNELNPYKHPSTQVITFNVSTTVDVYTFPVTTGEITLYGYTEDPNLSILYYLTIPNQSSNGVDITSALDNLTTGDRIKFTAVGDIVGGATYNFNFQIKSIRNIVGGVFIEIVSAYNYDPLVDGDPIATNTETIFTPFLNEPNFYASAFNPITNNADIARVDPEFFDVDFSSNAVYAVNRVNVISASRGQGVATPAPVQASNYTTARVINPRYVGSKNTSTNFNAIDNSQLPSVEQLTSYFIYTPGGLGNTLAERSGSGNYKIGFLVDELGNVIKPDPSSSNYFPSLIDAFGAETEIILSPTNGTTIDQSEYTIYKPAVVSNIIMYSDTGSLGNDYLVSGSYSSINFQIDPSNVLSYNFFAIKTGGDQTILTGASATASFNAVAIDVAQGYSSSINAYNPPFNSNIRNKIGGRLEINAGGTGYVTMSLMNGNTQLTQSAGAAPNTDLLLIATSSQYFDTSDFYWIKVTNNTNASIAVKDLDLLPPFDQPYFTITTQTSSIQANNFSGSTYWTTGSVGNLVLTSSYDIGKAYQYFAQVPITGSGFDNPQPLTILPYDEIRFDGNETKVATILSSSFDGSNAEQPVLYLYLQAPFAFDSVDINYFAIRRWVNSIDNLIINSPGTVMGPGLILPKYPSPVLKANLPSIVENLTNKNLI